MFIYKYKTSVQKEEDAKQIIKVLDLFFLDAILSFNLLDPDRILLIESQEDEDHSDIVIGAMKKFGFKCIQVVTANN
jgi:hypothetical protein